MCSSDLDSLDIFDANIVNIGIEFTAICPRDVNKNAVFNQAKEELFEKLNEVRPEIGESFRITEIFRILKSIDEILDVSDIKIVSKTTSSHSDYVLDLDSALSADGRMIYVPQSAIWELKYKNDITGNIL